MTETFTVWRINDYPHNNQYSLLAEHADTSVAIKCTLDDGGQAYMICREDGSRQYSVLIMNRFRFKERKKQ